MDRMSGAKRGLVVFVFEGLSLPDQIAECGRFVRATLYRSSQQLSLPVPPEELTEEVVRAAGGAWNEDIDCGTDLGGYTSTTSRRCWVKEPSCGRPTQRSRTGPSVWTASPSSSAGRRVDPARAHRRPHRHRPASDFGPTQARNLGSTGSHGAPHLRRLRPGLSTDPFIEAETGMTRRTESSEPVLEFGPDLHRRPGDLRPVPFTRPHASDPNRNPIFGGNMGLSIHPSSLAKPSRL